DEFARDERILQERHRRTVHVESAALPDSIPRDEIRRDGPSPGEHPSRDIVRYQVKESGGSQNEAVAESPYPSEQNGNQAVFPFECKRLHRRGVALLSPRQDDDESLDSPEDPIESVDPHSPFEHCSPRRFCTDLDSC